LKFDIGNFIRNWELVIRHLCTTGLAKN